MVISLIGVGKMGSALAKGWLSAGIKGDQLFIYDKNPLAIKAFEGKTQIAGTVEEAIQRGEVVVFAVKPKDLSPLLEDVAGLLRDKITISIAAGVPLKTLRSKTDSIWVRAMPNLACEVGQGLIAICGDEKGLEKAEEIFQLTGKVLKVEEHMMDAITALSGSGPAFVFLIMDALSDGGVKIGLPKELSLQIVSQLLLGSVALLQTSSLHPMQLKDNVCSPGGTTIAGVQVLERNGLRGIIMEAIETAFRRAEELRKISEERGENK
ncbi:pyrroline-5-carboxylate reductase [bacterium]|nr:pyrroline-5-carboxylate reductase [bacterium]